MKPGTLGFVPRPRKAMEALDLGLSLLQAHKAEVGAVWGLQVGLLLALALPFLWRVPLSLLLVVWWLKPWLDRGVLFVLGRAVFGQPASLWDFLRETRNVHRHGLAASLLWRRFAPARSFVLPVWQLEGLSGGAYRARVRVLSRQGSGTGILLSLSGWILTLLTFVGTIGLVQGMLPPGARVQLWSQFNAMPLGFQWLLVGIGILALSLTEPLFVAAGFGLYLNRRTQLEGWDLEQRFRRLRARLAPLLLLLLSALPLGSQPAPEAPRAVQALDAKPSAQGPFREGSEAWATAQRIWKQDPAFKHTRQTRVLHYRPTGREPRWLRTLLDALFGDAKAKVKNDSHLHLPASMGAWIALLGKILLVGGLLALLVWIIYSFHNRLRPPTVADEAWEAPAALAGLDIRPESLPEDVLDAARKLHARGESRAALALLYRGALADLVHRQGLEIPASATEGDCLRAAQEVLDPDPAGAFQALTLTWLRMAYNGEIPAQQVFDDLCAAWSGAFRGQA